MITRLVEYTKHRKYYQTTIPNPIYQLDEKQYQKQLNQKELTMTEEERYLFDVRGYMVLNQVLNEKELATLNATFDEIRCSLKTLMLAGHVIWI